MENTKFAQSICTSRLEYKAGNIIDRTTLKCIYERRLSYDEYSKIKKFDLLGFQSLLIIIQLQALTNPYHKDRVINSNMILTIMEVTFKISNE